MTILFRSIVLTNVAEASATCHTEPVDLPCQICSAYRLWHKK